MHVRSWLRKQVTLPNISIQTVLMIVVLYFMIAVGLSIFLSNDPNWSRWHISYLGESNKFSSHFFNFSLMVGGLLMGWMSWRLYNFLLKQNEIRKRTQSVRVKSVIFCYALIAISIYFVGLFPLSYGRIPHDIFGHMIYFTCLLLCIGAPWLAPGMKRYFYIVPYVLHTLTLGIFIMFWTGLSRNMYLAEVMTFIAFAWWTHVLINRSAIID